FINSDFWKSTPIKNAIERDRAGLTKVIPIILDPVRNWDKTPFAELETLPTTGVAVLDWVKEEQAFLDIAVGVGELALAIKRNTEAEDSSELAEGMEGLARLYKKQEKYQEAENLYLEALEIFKNNGARLKYATLVSNLASLYQTLYYYFEAEPLYKEALEIKKDIFGDNSVEYAEAVNNVAMIYYFQERYN
ncbi:tetratricopeptide repeat protein, partial [Anaplasma marginale]|uniref:tetratricopeptide repeat protein n=1 Tax=Anaplasma marginale TaxID=770 RepID=UPI0011452B95